MLAELLAPDFVERVVPDVAERVAQLLAESTAPAQRTGLVDAAAVADELGVSRAWVYEHADELGVERIGEGERPRLRFDLTRARAAFARSAGERSQGPRSQSTSGIAPSAPDEEQPRLPDRLPQPGSVLRSRPRNEEAGTCR
jgi:hypothetical protein